MNFSQRKIVEEKSQIYKMGQIIKQSDIKTYIKPEKTQQLDKIYSLIPLNLFQTWHTLELPTKMKENVDTLKSANPEFKHYLYDDDMCRDFIQKYFNMETLWAFDKLKPGAYKADLWRYCVLYIHGGIYLDIKFKCINGFKLIELTDKEHWVKDRKIAVNGIYQALLVTLPKNRILWSCIQDIIENCKKNNYSISELAISGPSLIGKYFNEPEYKHMTLQFNGSTITFKNYDILSYYDDYRNEQKAHEITKYYRTMWYEKDAFNYPILKSNRQEDFTKTIQRGGIELYSSNPFICEISQNVFMVNQRWVNYKYDENEGFKSVIPYYWISMNSKFNIDYSFNVISDEVFLQETFMDKKRFPKGVGLGLEDIRIIPYDGTLYYIATTMDPNRLLASMSSNIFPNETEEYKLERNVILPNFYDTNHFHIQEKNWSFVEYNNELHIVYKWYPLQLGKINYERKILDIVEIKYNIPDVFEDARGGSPGYIYENEIWFILHKSQHFTTYKKHHWNYQHFFAVFDRNMNLQKYSELFKLGTHPIEFCTGLIIKEGEIILSYGLKDTNSIISAYDKKYIENNIKWWYQNINSESIDTVN